MTRAAKARRTTPSRLELHLRRSGGVGRGLEERLALESGEASHDGAREQGDLGVVLLNGLVEAPALDGDTVFCPLELRLQREEVLVALEIRIALDRHQQAAQRAGELTLRGLEALECL